MNYLHWIPTIDSCVFVTEMNRNNEKNKIKRERRKSATQTTDSYLIF